VLDEARDQRPELRRQRLVVEPLGVHARLADNLLLPGLALQAGVLQDLGPSATSPSSATAWGADGKTRAVPEVKVGLSFDLPVPLRQARGRVAVAAAQRDRAAPQPRLLTDRVDIDVDDDRFAARAAAARVAAVAAEVAAAAAVEDAERARSEVSDATLLTVNLREGATVDARLTAMDAALEVRRAEVAFDAATARILGGGP